MTRQNRPESSRLSPREVWTLTMGCSGVAMVIAAAAALNTALPAMALETGATQNQLTWIVDSYTLCLAALLLPAGALGDRFGRREVLAIGLALMAVASAAPIWLDEPQRLIEFRALAGVGAALVMPSTLSLVTATFPPGHRSRGVAAWSAVGAVGGVMGLLGTGLLLEHWSWQSIFVAFAASATVLFALSWTLPASREPAPPPFDFPGALLAVLAIGLFVLGLLEAPIRGWSDPLAPAALVGGLVCAVAFVVVELRRSSPLLDVRLFGNRAFGAGATSMTFQFVGAFGMFFLIVQYMQLVLGYGPLQSGLALSPMFVPVLVTMVLIPWLLPRVGLRWLSFVGLGLTGSGVLILSTAGPQDGYGPAALGLLVFASGIGLCSAPATTAILENTPDDKQGVASAVNDTTRELGAAVGIALAGSLLAANYSRAIAPAVEAAPEPAKTPVGASLASALEVSKAAGPQGEQLAEFARAAFMGGMSQALQVLAAVLFVAAIGVAFYAPRRHTVDEVPEPARAGADQD